MHIQFSVLSTTGSTKAGTITRGRVQAPAEVHLPAMPPLIDTTPLPYQLTLQIPSSIHIHLTPHPWMHYDENTPQSTQHIPSSPYPYLICTCQWHPIHLIHIHCIQSYLQGHIYYNHLIPIILSILFHTLPTIIKLILNNKKIISLDHHHQLTWYQIQNLHPQNFEMFLI